MERISKIFLFAVSLSALSFSLTSAQAAIFDTMESVDLLKVIAAGQTVKGDRMPAGKESVPTKGDDETAPPTQTTPDSKPEN